MSVNNIYAIELAAIQAIMDMEDRGIRVDLDYLSSLKATLSDLVDKSIAEAAAIAPDLNIASPAQILAHYASTDTPLKDSADEKQLSKIVDKSPLARIILEYRKHKKLLTTYVEALLNQHLNEIIHPSFRTIEAETGRLSCSEPNLQNIPKEEGEFSIRRAFIPRDGFDLYAMDFNQQEVRLFAHYSRDKQLIKMFKQTDPDFHTDTAALIFGVDKKDVTKVQRTQAKSIVFGLLYSMGKDKLARTLKISVAEAEAIKAKYFEKFPTAKQLVNKTTKAAEERGWIKTFFGRRRFLHYRQGNEEINESHKALNTIIQGTAADIMKIMLVKINNFLKRRDDVSYDYPYGVRILLSIHDEIIIEVPHGQEGLVPFIKETLEYLPMFDVPMVVDVSLCSPSWANKTKITKEQLEEWKTKPVEVLPEDKFNPYKIVPILEPSPSYLIESALEVKRAEEQPVSFTGSLFKDYHGTTN